MEIAAAPAHILGRMPVASEEALSRPSDFSHERTEPRPRPNRRRTVIVAAMVCLLAAGAFLRIYPTSGFDNVGTDERGYAVFVRQIQTAGIWNYDAVVHVYTERQYRIKEAVVPATRIGFLVPAALIGEIFHVKALRALHFTAATAGVLLLLLSAVFAYRAGGTAMMLGVTALMTTAPLQVFLSQRALIDGYFAFWATAAVWLAWENLRCPRHWGWLVGYTVSLTIITLTKENAAFVVAAIFGVLLLNRFLRVGIVTPQLIVATIAGPAIAVLLLAGLMGGVGTWLDFNRMFVAKSRANFYSVMAQDGPWYRYAVDWVIVSPGLVAFACGGLFQTRRSDQVGTFLAAFLVLSFIAMSTVKYGISLRYAAFWDLPLCWLACAQAVALSRRFVQVRPALVRSGLILILSAIGMNQYVRFFVTGEVYDPITAALVWSSGMEKPIPPDAPSTIHPTTSGQSRPDA